MYLKVKNKVENYTLLGKSRIEVSQFMGKDPDEKEKYTWCYIVDSSWLKNTILFVDFEDDEVCYVYVRTRYRSPFRSSKANYIKVPKESM